MSWMTPKKTNLTRDLETKLTESGQSHLLYDALEAKERFAKRLKKTAFNPSLQEIYAHILGEIHSTFNLQIKPEISTAHKPGIIDNEIFKLASSIKVQIADSPADLGLDLTEVVGMLYYLTGNCYIDWTYNNDSL